MRDEVFVPGQPLSAADRVYADIDGRRMKGLVNEVVAISRRSRDDGNKYWGRIAGTKYEAMTGDWVEGKFKSLGTPGHSPQGVRPGAAVVPASTGTSPRPAAARR